MWTTSQTVDTVNSHNSQWACEQYHSGHCQQSHHSQWIMWLFTSQSVDTVNSNISQWACEQHHKQWTQSSVTPKSADSVGSHSQWTLPTVTPVSGHCSAMSQSVDLVNSDRAHQPTLSLLCEDHDIHCTASHQPSSTSTDTHPQTSIQLVNSRNHVYRWTEMHDLHLAQKASIVRIQGSPCVHTLVWLLPHRAVQLGWTCQECKTPTDIALGVTGTQAITPLQGTSTRWWC